MKKLYFRIFAVIMALTMMAMCMTGCMPADTYAMDDEPAATTEPIETEAKTVETEAPTVAPILETEPPATEPPADHVHIYTETVIAPTCVKEGYTRYACDCGYAYNGAITEIVDHNMIETERLDSTCVYNGYYIMSCTECDYEETHKLDAHNYIEIDRFGNSCNGYKIIYQCTECEDILEKDVDGDGHDMVRADDYPPCGQCNFYDYVCTVCGHYEREHVDPIYPEHELDENNICIHCGRSFIG